MPGRGDDVPTSVLPAIVGDGVGCIAPAKVNLWLRVTGRRDDGFHLIDSLVVFVSVADAVTVKPASQSTFLVSGPQAGGLPERQSENLAMQAADLMTAVAGERATPLAIHLTKTLPIASGVGGGSADAAAVIRCLMRLWSLDLPSWAEARIVALGADIPMCLRSATTFASGIGEILEPGPTGLQGLAVLLVNPGVSVSTPAVFKARRGTFSAPVQRLTPESRVDAQIATISSAGNDLEAAATSVCPEIATVLGVLKDRDGVLHAGLSGSGATCFALLGDQGQAQAAADAIAADHPTWWCRTGVIL